MIFRIIIVSSRVNFFQKKQYKMTFVCQAKRSRSPTQIKTSLVVIPILIGIVSRTTQRIKITFRLFS